MIDRSGHPTGTHFDPFREELSMFKTISAAVLAVAVLAAPAIAAKTTTKSATVTAQVKDPMNSNAKLTKHSVRHLRVAAKRHYKHVALKGHRIHKHVALKGHRTYKHVALK